MNISLITVDSGAESRPQVMELRTHSGYSAVRLLRLLPPSGRLVTVELDPLQSWERKLYWWHRLQALSGTVRNYMPI